MKKSTHARLMIIGAIGVVYGDIGTSPLYALKSCMLIGQLAINETNILGLISVFIWTLFFIVSIKYVSLVMTVDHNGEGGMLVLSALCAKIKRLKSKAVPILLGIFGASLFFGDGVITPAISVLSAIEGIKLISPIFTDYIMGAALVILTILFFIQKYGSGRLGVFFGPVMIIWFMSLGLLGIRGIMNAPEILMAFNPYYAVQFFMVNGWVAFLTMGGTVLVVTGAEGLYADLGHFGKRAIIVSWTYFVFPALLLNYLGQGALLLNSPEAISNPFYLLAPSALLYPLILLSTVSTIIASQAVISGVFSIIWQAILLNYLPRMRVVHTSNSQIGQVYIPAINLILYFLTAGSILFFRTSENLAVAYGLSVSGLMLITTIMIFFVAHYEWRWSKWKLMSVFCPLMLVDATFVATNLVKIVEGAWYTVLITLCGAYIISVWRKGNKALETQKFLAHQDLKKFIVKYESLFPKKIPGTAIFLTRSPKYVPNSLLLHLSHNKFLHEKMLFVSFDTPSVPRISSKNRFYIEKINEHTFAIEARFGFKEVPNLNTITHWAQDHNILTASEDISFFLSKGVPIASKSTNLSRFSKKIYMFMSKNALSAYEFYKIPHHAVIELGIRYTV